MACPGQLQRGGVGQQGFEGDRQTVGWHHVKADAGEQHAAPLLSFDVAAVEPFEDSDLARDVEVVRPRLQAGLDHWRTGGRKRTGSEKHALKRFQLACHALGC